MKPTFLQTSPIHSICIIVLIFLAFPILARSEKIVKNYELVPFNRLYLQGNFQIILEQSQHTGLRIEAEEKAFNDLIVDQDAHSMEIRITRKKFDFERPVLHLYFTDLENIQIEGGIKMETKGYVDLSDFYLRVDGGANIRMQIKADNMEVIGAGGVNISLTGATQQFQSLISGIGYLDASNLQAENVRIKIEGGGFGLVYATRTLHANIEGVGKIQYRGTPVVEKVIEGLGSVIHE